MNLAQLQTAIQDRGYGADTLTAQTDIINSVYRMIRGERQWWWLEKQDTSLQTVIGQPTYSTAGIADLLHFTAVRIQLPTNPYPQGVYDLKYTPPQELRSQEHTFRDNGVPQEWTQQANMLHLWPYPDNIYQIIVDYVRDPPDLAVSTDAPVFPPVYHDVLVWGAIAELTFRERDVFNNRTAEAKFEQRLQSMRNADNIRQRQTSRHVKRSGFYDRFTAHRWYGWIGYP